MKAPNSSKQLVSIPHVDLQPANGGVVHHHPSPKHILSQQRRQPATNLFWLADANTHVVHVSCHAIRINERKDSPLYKSLGPAADAGNVSTMLQAVEGQPQRNAIFGMNAGHHGSRIHQKPDGAEHPQPRHSHHG